MDLSKSIELQSMRHRRVSFTFKRVDVGTGEMTLERNEFVVDQVSKTDQCTRWASYCAWATLCIYPKYMTYIRNQGCSGCCKSPLSAYEVIELQIDAAVPPTLSDCFAMTPQEAEYDATRRKYKALAKKYHPDKNIDGIEDFKRIWAEWKSLEQEILARHAEGAPH